MSSADAGSVSREPSKQDSASLLRLLEESQAIAHIGGWEYDVPRRRITWTPEVYRIHGLDFDFDPNDIDRDISFYSADSAPVSPEAFRRALAEGEPYDLELQIDRADGKTIWVRTVGR